MTTEEALREELEAERRLSRVDRLTGVGTLVELDSILGQCFREGTSFVLVLFDVAHMKQANEVEGYPWTDRFLARVGGVLRRHRGDGFAIRQGGDEFMIVLPGESVKTAEAVRDRVERAVGVEILRDGTRVHLAGGIARWYESSRFADTVERAQARMKARKEAFAITG